MTIIKVTGIALQRTHVAQEAPFCSELPLSTMFVMVPPPPPASSAADGLWVTRREVRVGAGAGLMVRRGCSLVSTRTMGCCEC